MKNVNAMKELETKIEELMLESDLNYGEVESVLKKLQAIYMDKGQNLLKATSIKKVSEMHRFNR
ncbi:MAG: hypothetical protein N4A40_01605 [Tissierellales bacterium]|jgi:hypothetical protein|nr:hypothetical protein [Tissierellales bacterium]